MLGGMYAVIVRLHREAPGATEAEAATCKDAVMRVASEPDGLEYVYAQPDGAGVALVLWIAAPSLDSAEEKALGLFARMTAPELPLYTLSSCSVGLFDVVAEAMLENDR